MSIRKSSRNQMSAKTSDVGAMPAEHMDDTHGSQLVSTWYLCNFAREDFIVTRETSCKRPKTEQNSCYLSHLYQQTVHLQINCIHVKYRVEYRSRANSPTPEIIMLVSSFPHLKPQNSPALPELTPFNARALHMPTRPHIPTLHPLHSPNSPWPFSCFGICLPLNFLVAIAAIGVSLTPSSRTISHIVPITPLYSPGLTVVSRSPCHWPCILATSISSFKTATWARRNTVSKGSFRKSSAVFDIKLAN